jgi:hypothetical protein
MSKEILIVTGLLIFVILLVFLLLNEISKLHKRLNSLLNNSGNSNIEDSLNTLYHEVKDRHEIISRNDNDIEIIKENSRKYFNKFSILNYNGYGDMGGNMSFVLCLLNNENNGLLINSLHSRSGTRVYSKPILNGKYEGNLSDEEVKALEDALKNI